MVKKNIIITHALVKKLILQQFPYWGNLPINKVPLSGIDNTTFRLGKNMSIRLPSDEKYVNQVIKEQTWLPKLAPYLSLQIPEPLALGNPCQDYPWHWSIYRWIDGMSANMEIFTQEELIAIADSLSQFLKELQRIPIENAPYASADNFYRGGSLKIYERETKNALKKLKNSIDTNKVLSVWQTALDSEWEKKPVWIHGDISVGNILVKNKKLIAVTDFGQMAIGDPACDLVISWTFFKAKSREIFKSALLLDEKTWQRARGWALWKALITLASGKDKNNIDTIRQRFIINEIVEEHLLTQPTER